jgi:AcrR family transcriptional regulator
MTEATRRERNRADTDRQIRTVARTLLVSRGREGVTLRAIAREMGITAPALYRYYDSFEDLIQHVCADICVDLAAELTSDLSAIPDVDTTGQVFAVCRGFRTWAIRHPREFTLVFAGPAGPADLRAVGPTGPAGSSAPGAAGQVAGLGQLGSATDPFGRIFLTVAGRVLATRELVTPEDHEVPEQLRADLVEFRRTLFDTLADSGVQLPDHVFSLGAAYTMLRFWVRLYGLVALEVFDRFPFAVSDPESLFESMVTELAAEVGLTAH